MGSVNKSNHGVSKLALRRVNNGSPPGNRITAALCDLMEASRETFRQFGLFTTILGTWRNTSKSSSLRSIKSREANRKASATKPLKGSWQETLLAQKDRSLKVKAVMRV